MDLWSGSEDDGRGVYLHIMYARFLLIAFILDGPLCHGQNDTIFPNVNAEFQLAWPCMEPPNNPYVFYENHTFEAQPAISMDGLEWGTVDPPGGMGLIAVDALRVFYHSLDGQHIPAGTTVVLYDFGLAIGDTAYWDEYYGFGHALLVQIEIPLHTCRSKAGWPPVNSPLLFLFPCCFLSLAGHILQPSLRLPAGNR